MFLNINGYNFERSDTSKAYFWAVVGRKPLRLLRIDPGFDAHLQLSAALSWCYGLIEDSHSIGSSVRQAKFICTDRTSLIGRIAHKFFRS